MDQKLSTFLTLCSTMNYRRAADALHLTQPAVTKQIQALEAQYGVKLFSYDERKLRKTPQGEILERYAISLQYNDAELTRLLAEKPKTLLRIGALDRALPAGQAVIFVDVRKIFTDRDRSGRTDLFTDAAADAGNLAVFPGVFAQILVGAFDDDRVGALVDANELARALARRCIRSRRAGRAA